MLNLVTTHDPKQAIQFINHSDRDTLIQHWQLLLWSQRCSFRVGMGYKRITWVASTSGPLRSEVGLKEWSGFQHVTNRAERKHSQRPHASQLSAMLRVMSPAYPRVIPRPLSWILTPTKLAGDIQRCHSHSWLEIRPNIMQYDWNKAWTGEQISNMPWVKEN